MRRVIIESPYSGDVARNEAYARACVKSSVLSDEAPIASHLLFTQKGVLDDTNLSERALGIAAGFAWTAQAHLVAVYVDHGISSGMEDGIHQAKRVGVPIEFRKLYSTLTPEQEMALRTQYGLPLD